MDKFLFRVVGIDLDHDLKRYPEGSTVELTLEAAVTRRRWLELIDPVEDGTQPPVPAIPEPPVPTAAAFVSGPTRAEVALPAVVEPPVIVPTVTAAKAPPTPRAAAANKDKGASK